MFHSRNYTAKGIAGLTQKDFKIPGNHPIFIIINFRFCDRSVERLAPHTAGTRHYRAAREYLIKKQRIEDLNIMIKIRQGFFALSLFVLALTIGAQAQTQTLSLVNGDSLTPASAFVDLTGAKTYVGGFVTGQVTASTVTTFTFSVTFKEIGLVAGTTDIYQGSIVAPNSSFAVTQASGRKSVTTSGTIDTGTVTYSLTPDGRADIISIESDGLTIWEGKNKSRRAVGNGTLDYGTVVGGTGTMVLNFF
jgi:hypothetical protein